MTVGMMGVKHLISFMPSLSLESSVNCPLFP